MDFRHSPAEGRRIFVLANCQTGGLAACLDIFLPNDVVSAQAWSDNEASRASAAAMAAQSDIVVTSAPPAVVAKMVAENGLDESKCFVVPSIYFTGFAPDLTIAYCEGRAIDVVGATPYHSAIGVWCWKQGMTPAQASKLFTPLTMSAVGYDRCWAAAVAQARRHFDCSSVPFADFFLPLQASGRLFMHSLNHPHIAAIAQLARGIARLLGADEADLRQPVEAMVPDALSYGAVWPVYAGVAEALALPASSLWKFDNAFYDLEGYLEMQFKALDAAGGAVECEPSDDPSFDAAMRKVAVQ